MNGGCAVVRSTVPKLLLDDVFEAKEELANAVKHELTESMSSFGYVTSIELATSIQSNESIQPSQANPKQSDRITNSLTNSLPTW